MDSKNGRRVYVPSTKTFGTVIKEGGILGIPSSYAIVDDVGKKMVFVGDKLEFVYVDSSKNVKGETIDIPPDVVPMIKQTYSPLEAKKKIDQIYSTKSDERELAFAEFESEDNRPATTPAATTKKKSTTKSTKSTKSTKTTRKSSKSTKK